MISKSLFAFVPYISGNIRSQHTFEEQYRIAQVALRCPPTPLATVSSLIGASRALELSEKSSNVRDQSSCSTSPCIESLCRALDITPVDLLSLEFSEGERGLFLKRDVVKDDVILSIPLSSCIRDDMPPSWFIPEQFEDDDNPHHYNPSEWASRIAACLIDLELDRGPCLKNDEKLHAKKQWLEMMPDSKYLRASLPIHWPEDIVSKAKCTALEIAIDSSYFSRSAAVCDLMDALKNIDNVDRYLKEKMIDSETLCSNALDLVQTRSCRVESMDGIQVCPPLRVVAPIFDFINHGSCQYEGDKSANAYFGLEGEGANQALVVRSRRKIVAGQQVLIDYGDSARPAWRCLASYGFVPKYRILSSDDQPCDGADECVAEVFYNGCRHEVSSHTIPTELVEAAHAAYLEEEEGARAFEMTYIGSDESPQALLPEVALRLAKRISDASFDLVIDHVEDHGNSGNQSNSESIATELAKELRWSQNQVLLACALGLRDYAARHNE